jgi:hypothetical protein
MLNSLFGNEPSSFALEQTINFIRVYYQACGIGDYDEKPDKELLRSTLISARVSIRQLDNPSPFKKVAVFTHYFIYQCPIGKTLPAGVYPQEVPQRSYHNAAIAFEISRTCLFGAIITRNDGDKSLSNWIDISRHQHKDLMIAFCDVKKLDDAYARLIAIIYETLAYEYNPGVRYPPDAPLND